jgi:hypothetical protein
MAQKMGQKTFDAFLREYYTAHKWSIGTGAAFKQLLERQCQCDLTPIFQEQVYPKTSSDAAFERVSLTDGQLKNKLGAPSQVGHQALAASFSYIP